MSHRNMRRIATKLTAWFRPQRPRPSLRRTRNPYAVWISEIMLQQTQVKTVIPYFERWMRALPTVEAFARAPLARILKLWEGLRLLHRRVRNAQAAARLIVNGHAGRFPEDFRGPPGPARRGPLHRRRHLPASPSTNPRPFWTATSFAS